MQLRCVRDAEGLLEAHLDPKWILAKPAAQEHPTIHNISRIA